jgi:hypothetical protein
MKSIVIVLSTALLVACQPYAQQEKYPVLPEELQDCKFYRISDGASYITVARCPNSTTTVKTSGKGSKTSITIDGQQYVPRP